jgi:hypothetical protein
VINGCKHSPHLSSGTWLGCSPTGGLFVDGLAVIGLSSNAMSLARMAPGCIFALAPAHEAHVSQHFHNTIAPGILYIICSGVYLFSLCLSTCYITV